MLTRKQHQLLVFINQRLEETGVSPSFDEMKEALGLKSKSGIHRLITGLEEREFIRRLPHRAGSIVTVTGVLGCAASVFAGKTASTYRKIINRTRWENIRGMFFIGLCPLAQVSAVFKGIVDSLGCNNNYYIRL